MPLGNFKVNGATLQSPLQELWASLGTLAISVQDLSYENSSYPVPSGAQCGQSLKARETPELIKLQDFSKAQTPGSLGLLY